MLKKIFFFFFVLISGVCFSIDYSHWQQSDSNLSLTGETPIYPRIVINELTGVGICTYYSGSGPYIIKSAYSLDRGITWQNISTAIDSNARRFYSNDYIPYLCLDSDKNAAIIVWQDDTTNEIKSKYSNDNGLTWSPASVLGNGDGAASPWLSINQKDHYAICVWSESSSSSSTIHAAFADIANDGTVSWNPEDDVFFGSSIPTYNPCITINEDTARSLALWKLGYDPSTTGTITTSFKDHETGSWSAPVDTNLTASSFPSNSIFQPFFGFSLVDNKGFCIVQDGVTIRVKYTLDGGQTWNNSSAFGQVSPIIFSEQAYNYVPSVSFNPYNGQAIVIVTEQISTYLFKLSSLHSNDYGQNWSISEEILPIANIVSGPTALNTNTNQALITYYVNGIVKLIYSSDGGISWNDSNVNYDFLFSNGALLNINVNNNTGNGIIVWVDKNGILKSAYNEIPVTFPVTFPISMNIIRN